VSACNTMLIPWGRIPVVQGFDIGMLLQLDGPLVAHPAPKHAIATKVEIHHANTSSCAPIGCQRGVSTAHVIMVQGFDQSEGHIQHRLILRQFLIPCSVQNRGGKAW